MVTLSIVTHDKFDAFYKVFELLMREGYEGFSPALIEHFLKNDYSRLVFGYWLEKQFRRFSVAMEDNRIIGFLVGDYTYGGVGFISWVGVLPEYRGKGIGEMLLKDYEKFAKTRKAHLLELFTYDKVMGFYTKNGFKEIGRRNQGFYGQTNIIMNKSIGEWNDDNLAKKEI